MNETKNYIRNIDRKKSPVIDNYVANLDPWNLQGSGYKELIFYTTSVDTNVDSYDACCIFEDLLVSILEEDNEQIQEDLILLDLLFQKADSSDGLYRYYVIIGAMISCLYANTIIDDKMDREEKYIVLSWLIGILRILNHEEVKYNE